MLKMIQCWKTSLFIFSVEMKPYLTHDYSRMQTSCSITLYLPFSNGVHGICLIAELFCSFEYVEKCLYGNVSKANKIITCTSLRYHQWAFYIPTLKNKILYLKCISSFYNQPIATDGNLKKNVQNIKSLTPYLPFLVIVGTRASLLI